MRLAPFPRGFVRCRLCLQPILLATCLALLVSPAAHSGEGESTWWPFGSNQTSSTGDQAPAAEDESWLVSSPFVNVDWPEVKMPRLQWKPLWTPTDSRGEKGLLNGPVERIASATQAASKRTKAAWNSTIDRLRISDRRSSSSTSPGLWARLFGEPQQYEGPQTVEEWLAQERPGANRR